MKKDGRNADPTQDATLKMELRRLKQTGVRGVADRPSHFPTLIRIVTGGSEAWERGSLIERRQIIEATFRAIAEQAGDASLGKAVAELLGLNVLGAMTPLSVRRQRADRAYTGADYSRQPDTVQRSLERLLIDPYLIQSLGAKESASASARRLDLPRRADESQWEDDLDAALLAFSNQDFLRAESLLSPHLETISGPMGIDGRERLSARTLKLHGDVLRDRGQTKGVRSAQNAYRKAREVHQHLHDARHAAQDELMLAVVLEMNNQLSLAANEYRRLAMDERLPGTDRARAQLWIGTVLTKSGAGQEAVDAVEKGIQELDHAGVADAEMATGYQKLALAQLFADNLDAAHLALDTAEQEGIASSNLRRVRATVARGHLLISDPVTKDLGLHALQEAEIMAQLLGLTHQLRAIHSIMQDYHVK